MYLNSLQLNIHVNKLTLNLVPDGRMPPGEGRAEVFFEVNLSPRGGMARITPNHGTELDTVFKVFFSQWQDQVSNTDSMLVTSVSNLVFDLTGVASCDIRGITDIRCAETNFA